jgi:hypothetical protein
MPLQHQLARRFVQAPGKRNIGNFASAAARTVDHNAATENAAADTIADLQKHHILQPFRNAVLNAGR